MNGSLASRPPVEGGRPDAAEAKRQRGYLLGGPGVLCPLLCNTHKEGAAGACWLGVGAALSGEGMDALDCYRVRCWHSLRTA